MGGKLRSDQDVDPRRGAFGHERDRR
jgi:hypothetical protein